MEKKEIKERFFERFFYAEDGSHDWDRWRNQDPNVVLEFILEKLDKAREEGRREYARELLDDYYQPDSDSIEIDVSEIQSELSKLTTK